MRKDFSPLSREMEEEGFINLTPLIDVVFVVLILFILITPLLKFDRISLANGTPSSKRSGVSIQKNPLIKIQVFKDNTFWINQVRVSTPDLCSTLKASKKSQDFPSIPQVYIDKGASFGSYQTLKNALEVAGFEQVDLILRPEQFSENVD